MTDFTDATTDLRRLMSKIKEKATAAYVTSPAGPWYVAETPATDIPGGMYRALSSPEHGCFIEVPFFYDNGGSPGVCEGAPALLEYLSIVEPENVLDLVELAEISILQSEVANRTSALNMLKLQIAFFGFIKSTKQNLAAQFGRAAADLVVEDEFFTDIAPIVNPRADGDSPAVREKLLTGDFVPVTTQALAAHTGLYDAETSDMRNGRFTAAGAAGRDALARFAQAHGLASEREALIELLACLQIHAFDVDEASKHDNSRPLMGSFADASRRAADSIQLASRVPE